MFHTVETFCLEIASLIEDMKNNYKYQPTSHIYQQLITNSMHLGQHHRAKKVVNEILKDLDENRKWFILGGNKGRRLRTSIIDYFAKTRQIEKSLEFMNLLSNKFGSNILNGASYSAVLSGMALCVRDDKSLLDPAEKIFHQSFKVLGMNKLFIYKFCCL